MSANEMLATKQGVQLTNLADMCALAKYAVDAGFTPKGIDTPQKAVIAMQYGFELGFTPLQAINSVVVINGKPTLPGDTAKAVVYNSGLLKSYKEEIIGEIGKDTHGYRVTSERSDNGSVIVSEFTVADAKKAGLWDDPAKKSTWGKYSDRMLKYRALGFNLRDNFPDVLKGMVIKEEAEDYPQEPARTAEFTTIETATVDLKKELGLTPTTITQEQIDAIIASCKAWSIDADNAFEYACAAVSRHAKSWQEFTVTEAENILESLKSKAEVERITGARLAEQGTLEI